MGKKKGDSEVDSSFLTQDPIYKKSRFESRSQSPQSEVPRGVHMFQNPLTYVLGKKGGTEAAPGDSQAGPSQQQQQGAPQQQQQRGPQQQQQQRGPDQQQQERPQQQQQQQRGPQQQQQRGPPHEQQPQQQRGPQQQQQRGPQQQQQRGPQEQQQRRPDQQQQGRPQQQQQQQRGPQHQQQRGPQYEQQPQQQRGQQPRGPQQQQQQQRGPQPQQQRGPDQQQQGRPQQQQQQQQRGPQQQPQRQWGPPQQQQPQQGPVPQQQPAAAPPQGAVPQQRHWGSQAQQQQQQQQQGQQRGSPSQERAPPQQQRAGPPPQEGGQQQQRAPQAQQQPQPGQQQKSSPSRPHAGGGDTGDTSMDLVQVNPARTPGTRGRKIRIETNHIQINLGNLKEAFHYDVDIEPDTPKRILPRVVEVFRQAHFKNRHPAFDGRKNLYSSSLLPFGQVIEGEVQLSLDERMKTYKVKIQFANKVDLTPLQNMRDKNRSPAEALQCLDIVLRSAPALSNVTVGRNFFSKPRGQIIDLGEGMEMYHGFFQSAIRGWKPLLNVDVAHKAFPKNVSVIDALVDVCSSRDYPCRPQDPLQRINEQKFEKYMRMLKVVYEIPNNPSSRRGYRVNGLGEPADRKQFKPDNGPPVTIANYFANIKNYRLRFPHLPTLWVGSKQREDKILLPMELCVIEEGQAVQRKMTELQTRNMIRVSATNTTIRKEKIMRSIQGANYNANPCIKEFNFSVGNQFEKMEARVLPPPSIQYSDGTVAVSKGVWRGDNNKYIVGATISKWTVACATRGCRDMENFARMIESQGNRLGMRIAPVTKPLPMIQGRQSMSDVLQFMKSYASFDVIFVVVPNSGPQYGFVKKAAELKVGCLTQCIKVGTMNRLNPQTVGNILLKVNSKMNGKNHQIVNPDRPMILRKPCMIMGADVTHPGPDSMNIPSVAAVTASYDANAFCYNICYRLQSPKLEIIEDLEVIVKEQLMFFYQKCKLKPETIVFFRDGVSEGQFKIVRNSEIRAIRSACKAMGDGNYEPKLTFLVVQKRHHTRMFPLDQRDSQDRNMNVPAGTCVDQIITNPFMQDFYLVSHASIQGVAKPTKYCTIWDDNDLSNDEIEQLSYFLCHLFTRCNRSVSYPAPTYYAHLAAARGKVYIEDENLNMNKLREEQQRNYNILEVIQKGKPMFFV